MSTKPAGHRLRDWIDERYPLMRLWREQMTGYYAPKNFNFWYFFGSLAVLVLVLQIVTGIFLTMYYTPQADQAFESVEYIMRDVEWGWLIRFMHSTGASAFFIVIYLHMYRALLYGSYKRPRELLWVVGVLLYLALMAESFMGYLLPWGQMSYWGAQVITSLFGAIPFIGTDLEIWIRGDYGVSNATLNRFFAWHVIAVPLLLLGLVVIHLQSLRTTGSNNPDGIEIKEQKDAQGRPLDGVPFHPYYTIKDLVAAGIFLILFFAVVFYAPALGGWFLEPDNFVPANPFQTPPEIKPLWYLAPFYAVLRSIPHKLLGVLTMAAAILILFFLPWMDRSPIRSHRYRSRLFLASVLIFALTFIGLGYLGTQPPTPVRTDLAFRLTELYFSFFVLLWIYSLPRTRSYYYAALAIALLLLAGVDWLRSYDVPLGLIIRSYWIPALYWLAFLLLPGLTRLGLPKAVPKRIPS